MLKRWMFAGLVAFGMGLAAPAAAQVPPVQPGWTRLVNADWSERKGPTGGQCIDVPWSSKQAGTVVQMWRCHEGDNQLFWGLDVSQDSRIAVYSGADLRCLGFEPEEGKIIITDCSRAPRWRTTDQGAIATTDLQYCISVPDDGRPELVQCDPQKPQRRMIFGSNWTMDTLPEPFGKYDFALANDRFEDDCLDVRGGSTSPGASLVHYRCHYRDNQRLRVVGTKELVFLRVYHADATLCISNVLDHGNPASTQGVPCDRNNPRHGWRVVGDPTEGQKVQLRNAETGRCMDAFLKSQDLGTWPCHEGDNQEWWFLPL